jgi:hypothetical protein
LPEVLEKILKALKVNGICYMSFKYGAGDRYKDGRQFTDMDESQAQSLLKNLIIFYCYNNGLPLISVPIIMKIGLISYFKNKIE